MLTEHERSFTRVCFELEPPEDALETLGAQRDRWLLYRDMIRSRLRKMVQTGLKRTVEALGDPAYGRWFDRWLAEAPPRTRYIREVVPEFVDHVLPMWQRDDSIPPWLVELCRFERAKWEVGWIPTDPGEFGEMTFEKVPVVNPALRLLSLKHRVHEKLETGAAYPEQPVHVCVFRRPDDKVSTWTLKERTVWFIEEWQRGELATTDSVKKVAEARGLTIDGEFVTMIGSTLADLLEAGILLGAREPA